jgi:CubicO group peptidase (beta-lactamase class C family)
MGASRDGKVLLARGYGMANLETGTPITPETIFESGSVAKQFTATAVLLLARDGRLKLDDPVRKYMSEMPQYNRPITIRHLLTHTSGLREWSSLVAAEGWSRGERAHTQADLLDVVFRQKALNYPVGDYYSYTNSGYAIAMSLVETVSGKSFQQFTQERIFRPLGMVHTQWRDDFTRIIPGRAQAYARNDSVWTLAMPFESVVGPGGLLTTVGDWLIWNDALANNKLFPGHVDSLTQQMRLTSGRQIEYALGLFITHYRGLREIQHSGSTAGYSTFLARYPERGNLSIAVLCNSAEASPTAHVHQLADRLITDFPQAPRVDTTRVDSAAFAPRLGLYRNDRTRAVINVNEQTRARLRALPDGSYMLPSGARWLFDPRRLRIAQPDGDTVSYTFMSAKSWTPTLSQLRAYEGDYRSDELDVTYHVLMVGDSLAMSVRPGVGRILRPTVPDAFESRGTAVWFSRTSGRITAMHFSESRMWDLVLPRIQPPAR